MANTYAPLVAGTPITFKDSGGTITMTLAALASGAARQSPKTATLVDAGSPAKGLPALLEIVPEVVFGSAPTDGNLVDIYAGFSSSATAGTDNPGNLSGTDAALSTPASVIGQLAYCNSIVCSNAVGTNSQRTRRLIRPQDDYLMMVLVNNSGLALVSGLITVTPWYQQSS